MSDAVQVALITASSAVIVGSVPILTLIVKRVIGKATADVKAKNTEEHLLNAAILNRIDGKVDAIGASLTDHLTWHVAQTATPATQVVVHTHEKEVAA